MSLRSMLLDTRTTASGSYDHTDSVSSISLESELISIADIERDIQEKSDMVDHLTLVADGLEKISEVVEETCKEGGIDRTTASLLSAATENMVVPLGFDNPVLSLESYGSSGESLSATRVSLEQIREVMEKIWRAIENFIEQMQKKIKQWYKNVFDGATKLKNKSEELVKKAEGLNNKTKEENTFEINVSRLKMKEESSVTAAEILKGLKDIDGIASKALTKQADSVDRMSKDYITQLGEITKAESQKGGFGTWAGNVAAALVKACAESTSVIDSVSPKEGAGDKDKYGELTDGKVYASDTLMGNFAYVFKGPAGSVGNAEYRESLEAKATGTKGTKGTTGTTGAAAGGGTNSPSASDDDNKIVKAFNASSWELKRLEKETDTDKVDVDTPDPGQIKDIAVEIGNIAESLIKYKPKSDKLNKAIDKVKKAGKKFSKDTGKLSKEEINVNFCGDVARAAGKMADNLCTNPSKLILDHSMKSSLAAVNYCTQAIAQYK